MATFSATITYPDNKQVDLRDTICFELGYQATFDDGLGGTIPNPQTKTAFIQEKANEHLKYWIQNLYKAGKDRQSLVLVDSNLGATT